MHAMIQFPDLSPEIFSITIGSFEFALRWYALAYIVGILIAWRLAVAALRQPALWPASQPPMRPQQVEDLLTWIIIGVIVWTCFGKCLQATVTSLTRNASTIHLVYFPRIIFSYSTVGSTIWTTMMSSRMRTSTKMRTTTK